jgi:hypothetical protein
MCFAEALIDSQPPRFKSGKRIKRGRRQPLVSDGLHARQEAKQNREAAAFQRKKHPAIQAIHAR